MDLTNSTNSALDTVDDFVCTLVDDGLDNNTIINFVRDLESKTNKWIDVNDALPSDFGILPDVEILACDTSRNVWVAWTGKNNKFLDEWRGFSVANVSHWQPLPKPPEY